LLSNYTTSFPEDFKILKEFQTFVEGNTLCFERELEIGHITGSSWIVDRERTHVLLTYHAKLDKWLQLGGHADGMTDVSSVALKEAQEESGLKNFHLLKQDIFDIDIHRIPGKKPHYHYDVRFLLEADRGEPLIQSSESKDLAWIHIDEIEKKTQEPSVLRMAQKMKSL
jgi:8-oxo-dGTP pyrophosphatase MutT (NUDIX family)